MTDSIEYKELESKYNKLLGEHKELEFKYNKILDFVKHNVVCPLSQQNFFDPVTGADGITYEKQELARWFSKNGSNISPLTMEPISSVTYSSKFVKNLTELYLSLYPEEREYMYMPSTDYEYNITAIKTHLSNRQYAKITEFTSFKIGDMLNRSMFSKLFSDLKNRSNQNQPDPATPVPAETENLEMKKQIADAKEAFKYIINNCLDINEKDSNNKALINHMCDNAIQIEMFEYLLSKHKINLNDTDNAGNRIIHNILKSQNLSLVKYFISLKEIDLEHPSGTDGTYTVWRPIHYAAYLQSSEIIESLLKMNLDLGPSGQEGSPSRYTPDYLVLSNSRLTPEIKEALRQKITDLSAVQKNIKSEQEKIDKERIRAERRAEEIRIKQEKEKLEKERLEKEKERIRKERLEKEKNENKLHDIEHAEYNEVFG